MLAFARTPADALVLEVGMGGRLDATNVIERPLVTGIASLGLDHQQWLGPTLSDIAGEKAGIAKHDVPLVTLHYDGNAADRIGQVAAERGAPWFPLGSDWDVLSGPNGLQYRDEQGELLLPAPRLAGAHQQLNAGLAVAMLRHQDRLDVDERALRAAMESVQWPARLQRLGDGPLAVRREVWLDGGHNAAAARALADAMRPIAPLTLIAGCLRTKDAEGLLSPFLGLAREVLAVPVPDQDCYAPSELSDIAHALGFESTPFSGIKAALDHASNDRPSLIAGSLYLAGEVLRLNGETVT
jgi:dihydrofolate synthase/folylpolyglutamate synthase